MSRRLMLGLATTMLLLASTVASGQGLDFTKRPEKQQAELELKQRQWVQELAAIARREAAMAAGLAAPQAAGAIAIRGSILVNGRIVLIKQPIFLIPPDPIKPGTGDPDEELDAIESPPDRPMNGVLKSYVLDPSNFDAWIFSRQVKPEDRRLRLDEVLDAKIREVVRSDGWNEARNAKLRLAGSGDIKRFFDAVDVERTAFHAVKLTYGPGVEALARLNPLSDQFENGPFGDDSLFAKTLEKIRLEGRKQP